MQLHLLTLFSIILSSKQHKYNNNIIMHGLGNQFSYTLVYQNKLAFEVFRNGYTFFRYCYSTHRKKINHNFSICGYYGSVHETALMTS